MHQILLQLNDWWARRDEMARVLSAEPAEKTAFVVHAHVRARNRRAPDGLVASRHFEEPPGDSGASVDFRGVYVVVLTLQLHPWRIIPVESASESFSLRT